MNLAIWVGLDGGLIMIFGEPADGIQFHGTGLMMIMMTSSNGNIFRVTGPLCGEFTGPGEFPTQRPVTRSFDVFFDLRLNKRLSKQPWGWWFEAPSWSLWRQCNVKPALQGTCHFRILDSIPPLWVHHDQSSALANLWVEIRFNQSEQIKPVLWKTCGFLICLYSNAEAHYDQLSQCFFSETASFDSDFSGLSFHNKVRVLSGFSIAWTT